MKLCHVVIATPHRCGLYETARELVVAEVQAGHQAYIYDPKPTKYHPGDRDRGVSISKVIEPDTDVIVSHSGVDGVEIGDMPIIHVQHGRPLHSYLSEREGVASVLSYQHRWSKHPQSRAVVTFWPEHREFLEVLWGDVPVHVIPPATNIHFWKPIEAKPLDGSPSVVIADQWRRDCDPWWMLNAFVKFAQKYTDAKLHIYGKDENPKGRGVYLKIIQDMGNLGEVSGHVHATRLREVFSSADLVLSCNQIDTRLVREAQACGARIVWPENTLSQTVLKMGMALLEPKIRHVGRKDTAQMMTDIAQQALLGAVCGN